MVDVNVKGGESDDEELLTGNDIGNFASTRHHLTSFVNDLDKTANALSQDEKSSNRRKKEVLQLSYEETDALLKSLEEATRVLTTHYELLQHAEKTEEEGEQPSTRCQIIKDHIWRLLYKLTGSRAISATVLLQALSTGGPILDLLGLLLNLPDIPIIMDSAHTPELVCLVVLTIIDGIKMEQKEKHKALQVGSILVMILQVINLIIVVMVSVQLLDQFQKKRVSRVLLLQYFVTSMLLFAGIYTATYRINPKSWRFVEDTDSQGNPVLIVILYTRFLFFSASTATLCGAADALPKEWYNCLFVSAQMLLSFVYFTSVLSNVVTYNNRPKTRAKDLQRELQTIRNNARRWRSTAAENF